MFVINGVDYTLIVLTLVAALAVFALQWLLCKKAKRLFIKLIPLYGVALIFLLALYTATCDAGSGFIDLSSFVAVVIAVIGGVLGLFDGLAWLTHYILRKT